MAHAPCALAPAAEIAMCASVVVRMSMYYDAGDSGAFF